MAAEHVRGLQRISTDSFVTRCRTWNLSFEGDAPDDFHAANAWISLRLTDNEFGNTEHFDLTVTSERSRPKRKIRTSEEFMAYVHEIDMNPLDGLTEGTWDTEDLVSLVVTETFASDGIPRWAWRALMEDPEIRGALVELVELITGEEPNPDLFDDSLPRNGHLSLV